MNPELLRQIRSPADLRRLPQEQLPDVVDSLRSFIIGSVAASGGHLAASLGVVELTVALHYLFNTPEDSLVWDVGHQGYPHKALTGRREQLGAIRRKGGPSGFLRREESEHDAFGAGHSSTSISAALGIAIANARRGVPHHSVAIIGDGALTAGMAYEALNHAGAIRANLLVVLNDNGMSISPNVGALCESTRQADARPMFEQLGFSYAGPVDGHDLPALLTALSAMKQESGPRLLHVKTCKGQGYAPAEADPIAYHGVTAFDPAKGLCPATPSAATSTYSQVFGDWLCDEAARNPLLVAITPAMREGSCLTQFAARHPERYFDVGIAEQHSVTLAAGMASRGLRPVVAIYSTFLQRAYDQLIHDVCIQKLPVVFALDRAGVVGPDGATHNGSFDLAYLRSLPGMTVMTPADAVELRDMLHTAMCQPGPVAVRYPRTQVSTAGLERPAVRLPVGRAEVRRSGRHVVLLAFGALLPASLRAAEALDATVVNMRFVKPLDEQLVLRMARTHSLLVTLEDNVVAGGAGSAVAECLNAYGIGVSLLQLGLPDQFLEHGSRDEVLREAALDEQQIVRRVSQRLATLPSRMAAAPARSRFRGKIAHESTPGYVSGALLR